MDTATKAIAASAVIGNASMLGLFASLTWGDRIGLSAFLGFLLLWGAVLLVLSRPGAPRASQSENSPYLGSYDETAPRPRVRVGDDAEAILQNFREGKDI